MPSRFFRLGDKCVKPRVGVERIEVRIGADAIPDLYRQTVVDGIAQQNKRLIVFALMSINHCELIQRCSNVSVIEAKSAPLNGESIAQKLLGFRVARFFQQADSKIHRSSQSGTVLGTKYATAAFENPTGADANPLSKKFVYADFAL